LANKSSSLQPITADIDLLLICSSSEDYTEDLADNSELLNKAGAGGETILLADNNSNSNPVSSNLTNSLNGNSSNINNNLAPGLGTNDFSNPDVINAIN
jgi:hypothetical protein